MCVEKQSHLGIQDIFWGRLFRKGSRSTNCLLKPEVSRRVELQDERLSVQSQGSLLPGVLSIEPGYWYLPGSLCDSKMSWGLVGEGGSRVLTSLKQYFIIIRARNYHWKVEKQKIERRYAINIAVLLKVGKLEVVNKKI